MGEPSESRRGRKPAFFALERRLARLPPVLFFIGFLCLGYMPFTHAHYAVFQPLHWPNRSLGSLWLTFSLALQLPILAAVAISLGHATRAALRAIPGGGARVVEGESGEVGGRCSAYAAAVDRRLGPTVALLLLSLVLTATRAALAGEIYGRHFGEGLFAGPVRVRDLATPVTLAVVALVGLGAVVRLGRLRGDAADPSTGGLDSPERDPAGTGSGDDVPGRARVTGQLFLALGTAAFLLSPSAMGMGAHYDVPSLFAGGFELYLLAVLGLGAAAAPGPAALLGRLAGLRRLVAAAFLAEIGRVILRSEITVLLPIQSTDHLIFERQLFTEGHLVNAPVALVTVSALAALLAATLVSLRRAGGETFALPVASAVGGVGAGEGGEATRAAAVDRGVAGAAAPGATAVPLWRDWGEQAYHGLATLSFASVGLSVLSLGGFFLWQRLGELPDPAALPPIAGGVATTALGLAGVRLLLSAHLRPRALARGREDRRAPGDRRALTVVLASATVLCGLAALRLGWFWLGPG